MRLCQNGAERAGPVLKYDEKSDAASCYDFCRQESTCGRSAFNGYLYTQATAPREDEWRDSFLSTKTICKATPWAAATNENDNNNNNMRPCDE